jgi:hypothetical protein
MLTTLIVIGINSQGMEYEAKRTLKHWVFFKEMIVDNILKRAVTVHRSRTALETL